MCTSSFPGSYLHNSSFFLSKFCLVFTFFPPPPMKYVHGVKFKRNKFASENYMNYKENNVILILMKVY